MTWIENSFDIKSVSQDENILSKLFNLYLQESEVTLI
jgi:hypothetical protein